MSRIFPTILAILFFSILLFPQVSALEAVCEWELKNEKIVELGDFYSQGGQKIFVDLKSQQSQPIEFDCFLTKPTSLQKKLINFEFLIKTTENYDLNFSLVDSTGNEFASSLPVLEWYNIFPDKKANIVLDPSDFFLVDPKQLTGNETDFKTQITNFHLTIFADEIESITISDPQLKTITDHPTFALDENLPIQSTIPGFLGLILISFPLGFVLLSNSGFLKDENFLIRIPWFLGFGFCIYVVIIYLISQFWISLEIILIYLIIEFLILFLFLMKNKKYYTSFRKIKFDKSIVFFSVILIISAVLSVNYVDSIGWPMGKWDSVVHVPIISISMANQIIYDGTSYLPISDIPDHARRTSVPYPTGSHIAAAGLSFLTERFPAVSMESVFGFTIFLIPLMLTSFVYRFSKSIFLSSIMFMVTFWQPVNWYFGDIMISNIAMSHFAASVGSIALLTSFMFFVEYFEKENKLKWFIYFLLTIVALALIYYAFVALPILIGVVGFLIYHLKSKKKKIITLATLVTIFLSMPLWSYSLHNMAGLVQRIPYDHFKYASSTVSISFLPFWISTAFGIIFACYLLTKKQYRYFSIIVVFTSIIHLLAFSEELALNYTFFYKTLRSLGLMFLLSVAVNLIMINFLSSRVSGPFRYLSKLGQKNLFKITIIGILFLVLYPGFHIIDDRKDPDAFTQIRSSIYLVPGGNEKNLQYWLYENSSPDDLILNDLSSASEWLVGFRAQKLINGPRQSWQITSSYNRDSGTFEGGYPASRETLRANEILLYPWDYKKIEEIIQELDIKYIYISARDKFEYRCGTEWHLYDCYPSAFDWSWKKYSGDSRIAMYEEHPNLDLILRNGNSAIFKVT